MSSTFQACSVQSTPRTRPRGPKFYDSSGPLFSLYSDIAKEEDNKMTQHWKGEATDGVLVFVGPRVHHTCYYAPKLEQYRPVCFLPLSHPCSPYPSWTSSQILRTLPHSISRIFSRFLLTRTLRCHAHPSFPPFLHHPRSIHRPTPSG